MNKIIYLLFSAMLLLENIEVFADSPLTSSNFYKAYALVPIIEEASKCNGKLTDKLINYLADPIQPIDIKMALMNSLGWDIKGKTNATTFIKYLQEKRGYSSIKDLKEKSSADELISIAYLKAMDGYFDVKDALEYSNLAISKAKKSYTILLINALIYSQTFGYGNWCRKYQVMEKVRTNSGLIIDFKAEGTKIIFDYINIYKKYCSPFSKFQSK
jgi:hypothetical protein